MSSPASLPPSPGEIRLPREQQWNRKAIWAFAFAVVGVFPLFLLATVPALILGHQARREAPARGQKGGGLALAAVVIGWITLGFATIFFLAFVVGCGFNKCT